MWLLVLVGHCCQCCCGVMCVSMFHHVLLFATPWTVVHQALLSMEFSRQEYWSGLLFPPPGDLPNPGIKLKSPALAGSFFTTELPGKLRYMFHYISQLIEIKYTINVMCLNHPQTIPPPSPLWFVEKFSSTKPAPGVKKAEDHWSREFFMVGRLPFALWDV